MEDQQIDAFLAYVSLIEESSEQFSQEQVKKLELIRTKVGEILKKTQPPSQPANFQTPAPVSQISSVKIVESFETFVEVNEMIRKRGNKWVVLDKKGKKVLGTHPTKEKALAQMNQYVLSFTNFVNENRRYTGEQPYLFQEYKDKFDDFSFENDVPFLIKRIEEKWIELKEKYVWNREQPGARSDHFALNVKVYLFPDPDEVRNKLKVPELSDEETNKIWWKYLQDQAEALADDIDYSWVKDVSWGGKSGGWLLLHPNVTQDDTLEGITEECNSYLAVKDGIEEEVMADVKSRYEDPDFSELVEVGALNDLPEINQLRESAKSLVNYLNETLGELNSVEEGILEILNLVDNFKKEGLSWFYEFLEMEPDFALEPAYDSNR